MLPCKGMRCAFCITPNIYDCEDCSMAKECEGDCDNCKIQNKNSCEAYINVHCAHSYDDEDEE